MLEIYRGDKYKIIAVVAIFVIMGLGLIFLTNIGGSILTGVRGYIAGEGHWSKAQKSAVLSLSMYTLSNNPEHYEDFKKFLEVIDGYHAARVTLQSDNPDLAVALEGLLTGNANPEDIPHMKRLFLWFQDYSYLKKAIDIWEEGDEKIDELKSLARSVHLRMEDGNFPESEREEFLITIMALDSELSILEKNFSNTMSEAAHSVQNFIYWIALVAGLILILSGALLTIAIIRNTKEWNRKLYDAQNRINSIVENSGDVIYLMDLKTRKYDYMSPSVQSMLGYSADEVKKGGPEFILDKTHTDDIKRIKQRFEDLGAGNLESQININTEFRVQRKDGEYIWVNNKRSLIRDENGNPVAVVGNVREISERKKHEEEIDQSLKEKQILLQEIHHRVKNNLAIISSLLELQKDGVDDDVQEIFKETQSRIQSIALVHEKLYQSDTLAEINLSDYMSELTEVIASAYGSESRKVTLEKELDNMFINITDAVPLGLIFNELVNNSYKHAFKGRNDGVLKIKLKKDDTHCVLSVADNGNGLPHGFRIEEQQSLGMTLLTALTSQLEADINITSNGWTEFEIKFNLDHL